MTFAARAGRGPRAGPRRPAVASPRPRARPARGKCSAYANKTRGPATAALEGFDRAARTASAARRRRRDCRRPALFAGPSEGRETGVWVRSNSRPTPAVLQRSAVAHRSSPSGARLRGARRGTMRGVCQPSGPHLSSRAAPRSPPPSATRRVPPRRPTRRLRPEKCRPDTLAAAEIWLSAPRAPILTRTFGPYVERGPPWAQRRELRPFGLAGAARGRRKGAGWPSPRLSL